MESNTIVSHIADTGGCCFYRMRTPLWCAQTMKRDLKIIESPKFIPIPEWYQDVKMVRVQRQVSATQCDFFLKFLKPLSNRFGFWTSYEVDDVVGKDDIPKYNSGWAAYQDPTFFNNISSMMNAADYLTVTCEELAKYYITKFNVNSKNVLVIPNYMPRWWIGESYDINRISNRFDQLTSRKPRLCFPASTTHYDMSNRNGGVDDFTHVVDFVRATVDKYEWIFMGGVPQQLKDLAQMGKIIVINGFDLFNYPREISNLNIDIVIAPLQDNIFNRCKSNIKFTEMSALGIAGIYQDLHPYRKYTHNLFENSNDLQNKIDELLTSKEKYMDNIRHAKNIVDNGDSNAPNGWWLERNMQQWLEFYTIPQRTLVADVSTKVKERYTEFKNGIVTQDNGTKVVSL